MSENNLLHFAQVISDHHSSPQPSLPDQRSSHDRHYLPIRKNACIVCGVCFTCSQVYGSTCLCVELQPRRGRNLPDGTLDSRAKKLHPQDQDDYAFSLEWLSQHAHPMYKDNSEQLVGLCDLSEVSLCKAHSSTLYRAKKRHEKSRHEMTSPPPLSRPPSSSTSSPPHLQKQKQYESLSGGSGSGGLAAKVLEIIHQQQQQPPQQQLSPPQVDLRIQPSTSLKRKRPTPPPHSSASTPLYATTPLIFHRPSSSSFLPPLKQDQHGRNLSLNLSLNSLSSSLQEQLYLSNEPPYKHQPSPPSPPPVLRLPAVETVSLKAITGHPPTPPHYYFRNLAITDTFTFRDLLREIEMGPPPSNKRIVILDEKTETLFPLDQAIRNVIKRPPASHVELCLGLGDKAFIDWNSYT